MCDGRLMCDQTVRLAPKCVRAGVAGAAPPERAAGQGGRSPRGRSCLFLLEVIFHRWVPTTERTRSHGEQGTTM